MSVLGAIFRKYVGIFYCRNLTPLEARFAGLGYEIQDLNSQIKQEKLPNIIVERASRFVGPPETKAVVWVTVHQKHKYPSRRKNAVNIDLSSDESFQESIEKLKALFETEAELQRVAIKSANISLFGMADQRSIK